MLDEISCWIDDEKARDLIQRLEAKEIEQALPAEMELGLVWAISRLGPVEIEPFWYGDTLPDAFSEYLIPGCETVIEIAALSDAALPADLGMRNASRKISHEAGRIKKGASKRLSYYFYETSVAIGKQPYRRVCVPRDLKITSYIRDSIRMWVSAPSRRDGDTIRIQEGELDVAIKWNDRPQHQYNFRSSMPPEIRDIKDNYLYGVLQRKDKQLRSAMFCGTRCVILGDVGSTALRRVRAFDPAGRAFSGEQIIRSYLAKRTCGIDVVATVSARRARRRLDSLEETIEWETTVFCRPGLTIDESGFDSLQKSLPAPRREGYQARQLHEQGVFTPGKKGRHVGTRISWRRGENTEVRFSARAFLDALAGRIAPEQLLKMVSVGNDGTNVFERHLGKGETISSIKLEERSPEDDDDWIVVEFGDDPAARTFRNPVAEKGPEQ